MSTTRDKKAGRVIAKMSNRIILSTELEHGLFIQSYIYNFLRDNYANGRNFEKTLYAQDFIKFTTFSDCNYLYVNIDCNYNMDNGINEVTINNVQIEEVKDTSTSPTTYVPHKSNKKEILMNEPLRGLPNGTKDKYVIIDGKWYIERNTSEVVLDGDENWELDVNQNKNITLPFALHLDGLVPGKKKNVIVNILKENKLAEDDEKGYFTSGSISGGFRIRIPKTELETLDIKGCKKWLSQNNLKVLYELATPIYESIDYNPFKVYSDTTHISNNSIIPCNMVIKNNGYNCILKPSTLYTIALDTNKSGTIGMNLGGAKGTTSNNIATITTPATLTDNTLRLYGKGIKSSNVRLLEGDKTNWIPSHFEGMKSCFDDNLQDDGKYKMEILSKNKNLFNSEIFKDLSKFKVCFGTPEWRYYPIYVGKSKKVYLKRNYKDGITEYPMVLVSRYKDYGMNIGGWLPIIHKAHKEKYYEGFILSDDLGFVYIQTVSTDYEQIMSVIENCIICTEDIPYEPCIFNKIQFLLNEPLRAVGDSKDKVYVKEDKIIVERNCGTYTFNGSEKGWLLEFENSSSRFGLYNITNINMKQNGAFLCALYYPHAYAYKYNSFHFMQNGVRFNNDNHKFTTVSQWTQYLQQNPITVVYELTTPVYEEIEFSNNRLTLNSYDNSTLFYDTNIPVSNTSFKPLWEELVYVKNSTTYYIQFNAIGSGDVVVNLGGTELSTIITEGYNKIEITTPNKSTNLLTIDGQGIKISKVVVSEVLCGGYYKGLQSCFEEHMENGKYVCVIRGISLDGNKVNGIKFYLNEPLRGIGDIKDKLCVKDNKLMVERSCGEVVFDGSDDEYYYGSYVENEEGYYRYMIKLDYNSNNYKARNIYSVNNKYFNRVNQSHGNYSYVYCQGTDKDVLNIYIQSNDFTTFDEFSTLLKNNPLIIVYELEIPTYEEVTNEYGLPIMLEGYENGIVYVDSAVTPTTSIKYTSNNTVPATLSNVDNLNTTTQDDINNNIVTYMMDIDMMLTEMEMEDNASVMSLSDSDDNNQKHNRGHNNILDRMSKEDRIKYQDNTTKMLEKVIKGKSLTKEENINRIDLYLDEGKIREEQSNYLKELLKGGE